MEKLFRGFVETTFSNLKKTYGMPIIENDRATWTITLNERDYEVYDCTTTNNQEDRPRRSETPIDLVVPIEPRALLLF